MTSARHLPICLLLLGLVAGSATAQESEEKAAEPTDAELLERLRGDSRTRLFAIGPAGPRLWTDPESFYPAITACIDDEDPHVRRAVVTEIGRYMVWSPGQDADGNARPQDAGAIAFLMKHSHDDDPRTRYNAVYFGLSTVREKSDELIDRLLELMLGPQDPHHNNLDSRVRWALKATPGRAAKRIQRLIDRTGAEQNFSVSRLAMLQFELTQTFPTGLERFGDTCYALVMFTTQPDFAAKDAAAVKQMMTTLCGDSISVEELNVVLRQGEFHGVMLLRGLANYAALLTRLTESERLKVLFHYDLSLLGEQDRERRLNQMRKVVEEQHTKPAPDYAQAFRDLHALLGREYAHFELKGIDWEAVGQELIPRSKAIRTRSQFALLAQELVARLEDSHAYVLKGKYAPPSVSWPSWDPGFACLIDDQDLPVVYHVDPGSPADVAGIRVGMTVLEINGQPAGTRMEERAREIKRYSGYSSDRYLQYHVAQWIPREVQRGAVINLRMSLPGGQQESFEVNADLGTRYLPRLPVPIDDINDSANVAWKRLNDQTGYLYVRRIRNDLIEQLDAAVAELSDCQNLIIDVRGNSGGGFDAQRSFRNFDLDDDAEPQRPRFKGQIAVLIDSRCISAGEGWVSWFRANDRAKFFGETTAGASGRKKTVDILDGDFKVIFSVKAYRGFLDRPIERLGVEPDVPVRHTAANLARGVDTVLEAAIASLEANQ